MTNLQLRNELYKVKSQLSDALIAEAKRNGTESPLWQAVQAIWEEMNGKDYEK